MRFSLTLIAALSFCLACGPANTKPANVAATSQQPGTNPAPPADGEYFGKGIVTKIDNALGSVELDHEAVPGLMPAMRMEFFVADKAMLGGLALDDKVDFTILYKGGTETITKLNKTK
ncbi:MAG: copper-binding protein [Pyrinomonadaceae bacterium]